MESSSLVKAHEHVRNAATATYGNSIATAGHEHEHAATAFHEAAHDTHNAEALRILGLLEDHHKKLAVLIKEPPRRRDKTNDATKQPSETSSLSPPATTVARASSPSTSSPTRAPSRRRLPQSSIASNLAEKRGIPGPRRGPPSSTAVSVTNALAGRTERPSTPVRDMLERQSRKSDTDKRGDSQPSARDEKPVSASPTVTTPASDDNFRRFYSAFGGVISLMSAPLAFTSLPLNPAPAAPVSEPPPKKEEKGPKSRNQSPEASRTVKSSEPDLAALISKPAWRVLQEGNNLGGFANNESFYLVPTSGGTVSYANILQNPNAHGHPHHAAQNPHLDSIDEGDNEPDSGLKGSSHEEFVDAHETVGPPSPTATRRPHSRGKSTNAVATTRSIPAGRGIGLKTVEEIGLENETLKQLVDKQAKRLSMWETTSQSSYNALAQSFRARKISSDPSALAQALAIGANAVPPALPSPPAPPQTGPMHSPSTPTHPAPSPQADAEQARRIAELEALVATQTSKVSALATNNEQLVKQNERNAQVLGRYREQWEKLKAGARKKDHERKERRLAELRTNAGADVAKESDSGNGEEDVDVEGEAGVEEPGFGKA